MYHVKTWVRVTIPRFRSITHLITETGIDLQKENAPVHDVLSELIAERDEWKSKAEDCATVIERLEKRLNKKEASHPDLPGEIVRRLERVEHENARLRTEKADLKERLKPAENAKASLCHDNDNKDNKIKGANKKAKNAKEVAGKEGEKAKGAMHDKQQRLASERKMREERNRAMAALEEQRKINSDLRAELEVEQSGVPHARDSAENQNNVVAVVPIQFEVHRGDFRLLLTILEWNQMGLADNFKRLYEDWKKPEEEVETIVGANYVDDEKKKPRLYEDMVEMPYGYMETGAERDCWRSKRGLEAACRRAEARHNY